MLTATAAAGTAGGLRAWLATRAWLSPLALRRLTVALLALAVAASAIGLQSA
ncbi:MAG TPA: hypothetical protein VFY44_03225 [Thermoleophilaceae bacterium]|nr:hypothetical protein [Thermoleophilaceae bacterium]